MNKILAICTSPDKGGLELYFIKLIDYYHSKHESILPVCKKNSAIHKKINSNLFLVESINFFNIFTYAIKLAKIVDKNKIKIIHVSWAKDILLAVLIKKFCKSNVSLIYYRQMKITRMKNDFYHKFLYKNIDLILVITDKLVAEARKFLPVSDIKIQKLAYGISKPSLNVEQSKENFLKQYDFNPDISTIGVFSRIEDQKGQHLVIEAMHKIKPIATQLLIVGHFMNNHYRTLIENLILNYNFQKQVKFINFIDNPMSIMPYFDLIILPTYEETFGLVVAESMMMSVPVIGSNSGGVPEIIQDETNGLMFETRNSDSLAEKILMIINNKDFAKKLSQNAKVYAEQVYDYKKHFNLLNSYVDKI